jgi:hypothetical protein
MGHTMLTPLGGSAAMAHTVASLRAACDVLRIGVGGVTAISLSGRMPDGNLSVMPVLSAAERLAAEYDYAVTVRLDGRAFQVRFSAAAGMDATEPRDVG